MDSKRADAAGQDPTSSPDPPGADIVRLAVRNSPYCRHLGMEVREIGPGYATVGAEFRPELVTVGATVHGGAIASLIDTAAMAAAWSDAEISQEPRGASVSLAVTFMAPAREENVEARAEVIRRGRMLVFCDVEVRTASGATVAKGLVTYRLV
ncbi:MAG: PaaI family thioesterase [Actinomycetota bacterium]|nr:PaaI family thioesterase [Actinomycetota bacterium]